MYFFTFNNRYIRNNKQTNNKCLRINKYLIIKSEEIHNLNKEYYEHGLKFLESTIQNLDLSYDKYNDKIKDTTNITNKTYNGKNLESLIIDNKEVFDQNK
jgi:hypothetical protein